MLSSTEANSTKERASSSREDEAKRKSILIYSPDLNFCFSLSMLFQDRYTVSTTTNLSMLETFVANYAVDLIIIDAVPSSRIIERLDALRSLRCELPIIMLYVYNAKDVQLDQMIRDHVDSVFYKPFEIEAVSKRIEKLLVQ
ncbi:MAG TPA: response regulator [Bacteroidota bacterium]|nr:response regulator [Bacteroidota bacterium]